MARTYEQLVNYKTDNLMPYISFGSFLGLDDNVTTAPTDEASAESEGKNTLFDKLFNHTQFELDGNGLVSITGEGIDFSSAIIGFATKAEQDINGKDIIKYISNINGNDVDGYDFILGDNSVLKHIAGTPTKYFKEASFDNNNNQLIFTKGDNTTQTVTIPISSGEGGGTVTGGDLNVTNASINGSIISPAKLQLTLVGGNNGTEHTLSAVETAIRDASSNIISLYIKDLSFSNNILTLTRGNNTTKNVTINAAGVSSGSIEFTNSAAPNSDSQIKLYLDNTLKSTVNADIVKTSWFTTHVKGYYKGSNNTNIDTDTYNSQDARGLLYSSGTPSSSTGRTIRFLSTTRSQDTNTDTITPTNTYIACMDTAGEPFFALLSNINNSGGTVASANNADFATDAKYLTTGSSNTNSVVNRIKNGVITAGSNGTLSAVTPSTGFLYYNGSTYSWNNTIVKSSDLQNASVAYATSAGTATSTSFANYAKYLTSGTSSDYSFNKLTNGIIKADLSGNLSALSAPGSNLVNPSYALLKCTSTGYDWITPNNICAGALWSGLESSIINDGVIIATASSGPGSTGTGNSSAGIDAITASGYAVLIHDNTYRFLQVPSSPNSDDYVLTFNNSASGTTNKISWKNITIPASITMSNATDNDSSIYYLCGATRGSGNPGTLNTGTIYVSNTSPYFKNGGIYQTSDENLKIFVRDLDVDLDKLATIKKGLFYWKSDNSQTLNLGITAQSIEKLYPQIVTRSDEGVAAVSYSKLGVIALAAIDKLNQRIKELEAEVNNLKSK